MKKILNVALFSILIVSMFAGFAFAQEDDPWRAPPSTTDPTNPQATTFLNMWNSIYQMIRPLVEVVVGNTEDSEVFFAKVLLLAIVLAVVWQVSGRISLVEDNDTVRWVLAIAVSILAVRFFFPSELVRAIVLPYTALGVAITAGLPFVIFFWIVKDWTTTQTRIAWIFFTVVFVGLWISRKDLGGYGYIYLVTAILALISLVMDGTIKKYLHKMDMEKIDAHYNSAHRADIKDKMKEVKRRYKEDLDNYEAVWSRTTKKGSTAYRADLKALKTMMDDFRT